MLGPNTIGPLAKLDVVSKVKLNAPANAVAVSNFLVIDTLTSELRTFELCQAISSFICNTDKRQAACAILTI